MHKIVIALVGRPNVGKSTLFNRLSVSEKAIVHDLPGVTRDRKYARARIGPLEFTAIDTPGLAEFGEEKLAQKMMQQTLRAVLEADLVCLMVDGVQGVTPADRFFANMIRKTAKKCILLVNKCESNSAIKQEYYKLGFGEPVAISAEHAIGLMDLYEAITTALLDFLSESVKIADPLTVDYLQIVIAGRPNSGKSTFINAIIGYDRILTSSEAGTTRESIAIDWQYRNHKLKIIDTAGLRKKTNVKESLEKLSTNDSISSIRFANTVILMIDSQTPLAQQDLNIANHIVNEGRSLVIVINKWDLVNDKTKFKEELYHKLNTHLSQVKGVPVVFISALKKVNIYQVLDECINIYELWNKKITTSKLNKWLEFTTTAHRLPLQEAGRRVRIKYMTQIKTRPPTFKLFSNAPKKITESYTRYLINNMREQFELPGVPIRLIFTQTDNPYIKK